jgi:hypothetical protein
VDEAIIVAAETVAHSEKEDRKWLEGDANTAPRAMGLRTKAKMESGEGYETK